MTNQATEDEPEDREPSSGRNLARIETLLRAGLIGGLILIALWSVGRVLLVIFAGALFGVLLNGLVRLTQEASKVSRSYAFTAVIAALALMVAGTAYFLLPGIITQTSELADSLSSALANISQLLAKYAPSLQVSLGQMLGAANLPFRLFGFTSSLTTALITVALVIFIGFYGALDASLYRSGLLRVVPRARRDEAKAILTSLCSTLEWWLLGRAITMSAVGLITLVCLLLLGIRLAVTLSLIAGLLTFIPYLGAIVSAIPAVLVAFVQGPTIALYVVLVYVGAHTVEGYLLAPLVQRRTVHLPPALMLATQALLGTLFGIAGLALAAPLAAAAVVLVPVLAGRDDGADEDQMLSPRGR